MDATELQRHPLRNHPLFATGMDEQQIFLPILEEPEIAAGVAFLRRDVEAARRRYPARHRGGDMGLDALEGVDLDALTPAHPWYQLSVVAGAPPQGRFL